jgi:isopenicillin N synthase-like dioxygenase
MGSQSHIVAGIDMTDLYPAPFPDDIATIELGTISVAKLLAGDAEEAKRIFAFCQDPGFFNLDLTDHPDGVQLLRHAVHCNRLANKMFALPIDRKREFLTRQDRGAGVFDCGYFTKDVLPNGEVKYNETMNVS